MKNKPVSALFVIASLSLSAIVSGQVPAAADEKNRGQQELETRKELEKKTLVLLDEVINGAWGLKLPENRSFVLTTTADLLWPHDEKRARNLFWDALNSLNLPPPAALSSPASSAVKEAPGKEPPPKDAKGNTSKQTASATPSKEQMEELDRYYKIYSKRRDFLRKVAVHDSQLALDMLRATRQSPPPRMPNDFVVPSESDLQQQIASVALVSDPKRALQIARQSLAKGISLDLTMLLNQLNQRDQPAASEFATDIIARLDGEDLTTNLNALLVASDLLTQSRAPQPAVEQEATAANYRLLNLTDEQKRGLVQKITDAALSASARGNLWYTVRYIMPDIEEYAPDRAARIKTKLAEWNRTLNPEQQQLNSLYESNDPEQIIRTAEKIRSDERESLDRNAVVMAVARGRSDALREFINTQVEDQTHKNSLLDLLDAEQIADAAHRGKPEELQKILPLVRLKAQRADAMAELALVLEQQGRHDDAVALLDEARGLVKVDLSNEKQSNALLGLMLAYAIIQPDKAFQMIEPIVDHANEDISKLLLLDRVVKTGATRNGEIVLVQPQIPLDFAMLKYSRGMIALANADFNRTKSLADRFERSELRLLARLLLAQALLRRN